jgi:hypothetical protein
MRKVLPMLLFILAVGLLLAQDTPNFSGTWVLDKEKSDPMGGMMGMGGRQGGGAPGSGTPVQPDVTLEIKHEGVNLAITRKVNRGGQEMAQDLKYTTDGAENRNPGMGMGSAETVSKSHWEGKKLVTESSMTRSTPDGDMTMKNKEVRFLSDDGKVLTIEITTSGTPRGDFTRKQVFNKK